jgi:two-component system OmpR family sensor kinase
VAAPTTGHAAGTETTELRRRPGWSVRTRIITAVALLVTLALAGAGAIVYAVESARLQELAVDRINQELDEFAALDDEGIDPETGEDFADVRSLLVTFLERNVPDEHEVLVAWYGGRARDALPGRDQYVRRDGDFERSVAAMLADGGTDHVQTPYGEAMLTVQNVASGQQTGALVIVTYVDRDQAELRTTMQTYALVSLVSILLITAIATWQSGRLLAPLRTLRETADDIRASDLSLRIPERGNDDITALTHTLNDMLARLEAAFVGQRQFLDDAGHELKTPLTILRGHLELLDHQNAEEVAEVRALLLDEIDRMARLVGDLILLAKHDRPDFLRPTAVSVERLTHSLYAKARALADRTWALDEVGEGIAHLDEQRITQAVLQLADNAVKHTADGDRIAIGSRVADGRVSLWVSDSGPGVPPELRDHVFERFGRAGVVAGDEGFGLGLSIVKAIAQSHGGTVRIDDAVPHGAVVTIELWQEPRWHDS